MVHGTNFQPRCSQKDRESQCDVHSHFFIMYFAVGVKFYGWMEILIPDVISWLHLLDGHAHNVIGLYFSWPWIMK